jgi:hypothetical protein
LIRSGEERGRREEGSKGRKEENERGGKRVNFTFCERSECLEGERGVDPL